MARARAWLTERVPALLADTTTPIRILATTAQALTDTNHTAQLRTAILARQRPDGLFATPGTADALYDELSAHMALATSREIEPRKSTLALLKLQHADGGWSASMGKSGHADTVSTASIMLALVRRELAESSAREPANVRNENQRAHNLAAQFLESHQDETTGLLGYETSSYGAWGATAAGFMGLSIANQQSLATRRAYVALSSPELRTYPARDPLREAFLLTLTLAALPQHAARAYTESLTYELARQQQPDGRWPATKPQTDEILATGNAIILSQLLAQLPAKPVARAAPFATLKPQNLAEKSTTQLLLTLSAETADLLLIAPEKITNTNLLALCNQASLMTALQRRFTNPETKNLNTLGWKLADITKDARPGPINFDRIANHIADEKNIPVQNILGTDDLAAALDLLTDKQLARALSELEKISVRDHLNNARNAWARNDRTTLENEIAALIPPTLRPVLDRLSSIAAERIRTQLQKNPDTLLILDAFLAFGPHGILAQLSEK